MTEMHTTQIHATDRRAQPTAVMRDNVPVDEMPAFFAKAFATTYAVMQRQGRQPAGPPFGLYHGMPGRTVDVEAGFPLSEPITPQDGVVDGILPGGPAVEAVHVGPYDTLQETYTDVLRWMGEQGMKPTGLMWEAYLTDPATAPDPATWETLVVQPVA